MQLVLFSHADPRNPATAPERDLRRLAESAQHAGVRVVSVPTRFNRVDAYDAVWHLPVQQAAGLLSGYFTDWGTYTQLEQAAAARGVRLLNTAVQSRQLMEFDLFYPRISDLTARSVIINSVSELDRTRGLKFPVFCKGLIKSAKEQGLQACLAAGPSELEVRFKQLALGRAGGGKLVVRELLPLRSQGEVMGFPVSREYRVLLYAGRVLGHGFYWDGADPFGPLAGAEEQQALSLAAQAADRMDAPLVAVDVGQLQDGSWKVIEVGDPQFSGVAHMPHHAFFAALLDAL